MRKITEKLAQAFRARKPIRLSNSEVKVDPKTKCVELYLHGNRIAWTYKPRAKSIRARYGDEYLVISLAGWDSRTTRERLHGLLTYLRYPMAIARRKGETCLVVSHDGKRPRTPNPCWLPMPDDCERGLAVTMSVFKLDPKIYWPHYDSTRPLLLGGGLIATPVTPTPTPTKKKPNAQAIPQPTARKFAPTAYNAKRCEAVLGLPPS